MHFYHNYFGHSLSITPRHSQRPLISLVKSSRQIPISVEISCQIHINFAIHKRSLTQSAFKRAPQQCLLFPNVPKSHTVRIYEFFIFKVEVKSRLSSYLARCNVSCFYCQSSDLGNPARNLKLYVDSTCRNVTSVNVRIAKNTNHKMFHQMKISRSD